MPRIVVVGAGITGLAAAYELRTRAPGLEVTVLEATSRAGGLIRTEVGDGYVIERGPESIITDKPAGLALVEALGISNRLVRTEPENRGAYVVAHGKLERIPNGFQLLAPTDLRAWLGTSYVSLPGRVRALFDLVLPSGASGDESLASFVTRRFGREVLDRLAQPLVGGIYGAHPDVLGLEATMPRFLEAERSHGSVIRGLRARETASAHGARYGLFVNFDRGMQVLTDAACDAVRDAIRFGASVRALGRRGQGFVLDCDGREEIADALVVSGGGRATARLVRGVDPILADQVGAIRHGSGAIVTFVFRRDRIEHPLDTYGYVTPFVEGRRVIASTFLSRKWPGRAPAGFELLRFFLGRDGDDAVVDLPEDELVAIARREASEMLGARGEPELVRVDRWRDAMPRFGVNHLRAVEAIEARVSTIPGFAIAGNAYRGVGIPDSIASGRRAAERVLGHLGVAR